MKEVATYHPPDTNNATANDILLPAADPFIMIAGYLRSTAIPDEIVVEVKVKSMIAENENLGCKSRCEEKRGRGDESPGSWSMKVKIVSVMQALLVKRLSPETYQTSCSKSFLAFNTVLATGVTLSLRKFFLLRSLTISLFSNSSSKRSSTNNANYSFTMGQFKGRC